jgi:hypothetical protein
LVFYHNLSIINNTCRWKSFLSLVQKSHYQSAHIPKILAALDVYRGLADVIAIKVLIISKVQSMLLHNYTKVRIAAAENLLLLSKTSSTKAALTAQDWSKSRADLKATVDGL